MIVLLDNGHGGIINGVYQTNGKQKDWGEHGRIYEGEFNRAIVNGIIEELTKRDIPYVNIVPEYKDITLYTRVKRANDYANKDCFYLSIHANAGGGHGFEVFTSPGITKSDYIANIFAEEFKNEFPDRRIREGARVGFFNKEANFFVLRRTYMPAILTENFFMDNFDEFKNILNTRQGRQKIIDFHIKAILRTKSEIFHS